MNEVVRVGGKLALICAIAAIALGLVNAVTAPAIDRVQQEQLAAALNDVRGTADAGEAHVVPGHPVVREYYPLTGDGNDAGYILRLVGTGYGGDMEILSSIAPDGEIRAVKMMTNSETPGLGKAAENPTYMEKFIGTGDEELIPMNKQQLSQGEADSISGATITFMGIAQALKTGSEYVTQEIE